MTDKEKEILEQLKINPYISQKELSEKIKLSRSATANYITKLTKRGIIKGRAYILQDTHTLVCIGGANIDIKAHSSQKIRLYSSNPVEIIEVCGGVARNFAECFSNLEINTTLISCISNDKEGIWLLNETKKVGVDVSQMIIFPSERTGTFTDLLDIDDESIVSMAGNNIHTKMTPEILKEKWSQIATAKAVLLDANIPKESMKYLIQNLFEKEIPLFIDPVSPARSENVPTSLDGVLLINPNKAVAEALTKISISNKNDCIKACANLSNRGVKNIVIILSNDEIYYHSELESGSLSLNSISFKDKKQRYVFFSNVFLSLIQGNSILKSCKMNDN